MIQVESPTDTPEEVAAANAKANPAKVEDNPAADSSAKTVEASETSGDEKISKEEAIDQKAVDEKADAQDKSKKKNGVQARIDELTKQREDARREAQALRQELAKSKPAQAETITAPVAAAGEPDPDKFETNAAYMKALAKFEIQEERKALEQKHETQKQQELESLLVERTKTSILSFKESHSDFDEVVTDEVKTTPALERAILESEDPARLMYELCKNPEEHKKVIALTGDKLARAIGRFEAKFETVSTETEPKTTTNAPPPINPVGSKSTNASRKSIRDEGLSQREYEQLRLEQMKARRA